MGLFDNIGQNRNTGQLTFVQEAKAFATLDLNTIFKEGTKALIDIIGNATAFFKDVFGSSDCNDQDRVLYERMKDQLPGMIIVLVHLGWEDSTNLQAYNDQPQRADYGGRPKGAFPCNEGIGPARAIFTALFGVRILNSNYLDALENGSDAYYNVDGGALTYDIPREAVARAVRLKQQYFPNRSYNSWLWDLNKFQENPLVAPIPDPVKVGQLFTGNIFGVDVVRGYVQGSPIPDLPTSTTVPILVTDPYHDIIYPAGNPGGSATTTNTAPTPNGTLLDKFISFVKTNPIPSVAIAAAVGFVALELDDDD